MNICFVYRDLFAQGGVPTEIRSFIKGLPASSRVTVFAKNGQQIDDHLQDLREAEIFLYSNVFHLMILLFTHLKKCQPMVVGVGFFLLDVAFTALVSKILKKKFLVWPIGQVTKISMSGKVFNVFPGVTALQKGQSINGFLKYKFAIFAKLAPFYKLIYLKTFGELTVSCASHVGYFSEFEKEQFSDCLNVTNKIFVKMLWGIDSTRTPHSTNNYYDHIGENKSLKKVIYWGRVDWFYKGIDRILDGVQSAKEKLRDDVGFKVYFCGPDYNNGLAKLKDEITRRGLQDNVMYIEQDNYESGSVDPFYYADASILLSRWDGIPRSLRESIYLGIPVITSEETNFGDLMRNTECGLTLTEPFTGLSVANSLMAICNDENFNLLKKNTFKLKNDLAWNEVAEKFVEQIKNDV